MQQRRIGLQLYTVREECARDFEGTLRALADMGYRGVEFAGIYGGMTPDQLAAFLKSLGLEVAGFHVGVDEVCNPDGAVYKYAAATGAKYVTTGLWDDVKTGWEDSIRRLSQAGAVAGEHGLIFTYHNHSQEFEKINGAYALDMLYQQVDCAIIQAEIDVFWVEYAGVDPVDYIAKYPGRVPQIHVKDMDPDTHWFTEVGTGTLDWHAVWDAAEAAGTDWMIVEQDECTIPPLESVRKSIDYLKRVGLA